jgi:glycosyltransferase involved in cell wall biosynthesis
MEAMASGVPVVASGISGIPELVIDGKNGFLVPPKEPKAIANVLDKLYNDEELQADLGHAGRQTVLQKFDLFKNTNTLIQMIADTNRS